MDFSPLATFLDGKLINAFDASALVFADDAKTTPCGNDDPVYRWGSSGGVSSLDLTQSVLASRPIFRDNYETEGYPAIVFDGSNDFLDLASFGDSDYGDEFGVFVVGRVLSFTTKCYAARSVLSGNCFAYYTSTSAAINQIQTSAGSVNTGATRFTGATTEGVSAFGFSAGYAMSITSNGASSIYYDGATPAVSTSGWRICTFNGSTFAINAAVRSVVFTAGLSVDQFYATANWLAEHYGYTPAISAGGGGTAGFTGVRGLSRRLGT